MRSRRYHRLSPTNERLRNYLLAPRATLTISIHLRLSRAQDYPMIPTPSVSSFSPFSASGRVCSIIRQHIPTSQVSGREIFRRSSGYVIMVVYNTGKREETYHGTLLGFRCAGTYVVELGGTGLEACSRMPRVDAKIGNHATMGIKLGLTNSKVRTSGKIKGHH